MSNATLFFFGLGPSKNPVGNRRAAKRCATSLEAYSSDGGFCVFAFNFATKSTKLSFGKIGVSFFVGLRANIAAFISSNFSCLVFVVIAKFPSLKVRGFIYTAKLYACAASEMRHKLLHLRLISLFAFVLL